MKDPITQGVDLLDQAADIRIAITEMYRKYKSLTTLMKDLQEGVSHRDIKTAVDAVHYFGGVGYPHPNSPGRMEELLDKTAGMFKILHFIGKGHMVTDHLAVHGIHIAFNKGHELKNANLSATELSQAQKVCQVLGIDPPGELNTVKEFFAFGIDTLNGLQTTICQNANVIRKELKPTITDLLDLEREELKRSMQAARLRKSDRLGTATTRRKTNVKSMKAYLSVSKRIEGVD